MAMKPRIVFFGNSESVFSNRHYRALARSPCRIVGVVDTPLAGRTTTNTARLKQEAFTRSAARAGIPAFAPDNPNSPDFIGKLKSLRPDLFIAAGYMKIMKPALLETPAIAAANFHASLLPAYRGKHPVFRALRNGEQSAGLTVHLMDARLDTGGILYQVRVRTRRQDTVGTLYDRIMRKSVKLVPQLVRDAGRGRLRPKPQAERGASYFSSATEDDFRLDWRKDAETLRRRICATPARCFFDCGGERVFVNAADTAARRSPAPPGTIVRLGRKIGSIATGRRMLAIAAVTPAQGRRETMVEFCRRRRLAEGACLRRNHDGAC